MASEYSEMTPTPNAQRQAHWRKRRDERLATLIEAMQRIRDEAKTIGNAREIAAEALKAVGNQ